MKHFLLSLSVLLLLLNSVLTNTSTASPGDTTIVQAFTFGSPQDAWFIFPADTIQFEKILMKYKLKCNPAQNPACGEWDYLTYTYLYQHTGNLDSTILTHNNYIFEGSTPDTLIFMNEPSWNYFPQMEFFNLTPDTSLAEISSASISSSNPFYSNALDSKSFILWKANELLTAGLFAGDITSLAFDFVQSGCDLSNLSISIKNTNQDSLNPDDIENEGFTNVYTRNTSFTSTGWTIIPLTYPFTWDGTSNILIRIGYSGRSPINSNIVNASNTSFPSVLASSSPDFFAEFNGPDWIDVPSSVFNGTDSAVTIAFWAYGDPADQPQDGVLFEGINAAGQRVLNVHLPWSNGRVYWDCGNTGGSYDRIDKACDSAAMYKGKWNHWAFTKDVSTGIMTIYFNGKPWYSVSGLTRTLDTISKFRIGASGNGSWGFYDGWVDDFSIWNTALDSMAISEIMYNNLTPSHPDYAFLKAYYPMDEGTGYITYDQSPDESIAAFYGMPSWKNYNGHDRFRNFKSDTIRCDIRFGQGAYNINSLDSLWVIDSTAKPEMMIVLFADSLNPTVATDTLIKWSTYSNNYIFDSLGNATDSTFVIPDDTLYKKIWYYFSDPFEIINRYELGRYITPYGNGLSLGDGWTWTFDVSDYRTLLADSVHLTAGNWQELLDMQFIMIEGTPPRDILSIRNLWNGGFNYGQSGDPIENHLKPIPVYISSDAKTARWKSRITGHGMDTPQNCAEFCAKYHYYKVDSVQRFSKLVWRDNCDLNPLYPQGGTWVYDRANWCPGAEVWTYDFELTPFITPGDTIVLDHDVQPYINTGGWDYYQIEDQLVTYGPPNFSLDAAIDFVISPSNDQMWKRLNPVCMNPTVIIKNTGSSDLVTLKITYGITGATQSIYNWVGALHFLESAQVTLDSFAWMQGASTFTTSISEPNGAIDQYPNNNTVITPFAAVQLMPSQFVIEFKTNNWYYENEWELKDVSGNLVFSRIGLAANTTYKDTISLSDGCYEFRLTDSGEDGLTWWANTQQGSGSIRLRSSTTNQVYKNFGSDFGGEVYMQFIVGETYGVDDYIFTKDPVLNIYPNPAKDNLTIDIDLPQRQNGIIELSNICGKVIKTWSFDQKIAESLQINISDLPKGFYIICLKTASTNISKKLIIQ